MLPAGMGCSQLVGVFLLVKLQGKLSGEVQVPSARVSSAIASRPSVLTPVRIGCTVPVQTGTQGGSSSSRFTAEARLADSC